MPPARRAYATLPLIDIGCGSSAPLAVERQLARVPGVVGVYVNRLTEKAYVEYDPARCGPPELAAALRHLGYGGTAP